ncbi:elongation factor 2, partial [Tanacetum coccineum]
NEMTDAALKNLKGEHKGNKHLDMLMFLLRKDFTRFKVDGEEAYQKIQRVIESVNGIILTHEDPLLGDVMVYPKKGTVAFSTGIHGWAVTLNHFAKLYAFKFGIDEAKMMEMLWDDNFYDPKTKEWTTKNTGSGSCKRGFLQYVYEPVRQIISICKWLPAVNLLEMMILHLHSPCTAQKYRVENLYEGPPDDVYANAIRSCDPNGPLMFYVSKMIPASNESGRFFSFGRVFAGKVSPAMKARIMGPNYVPGETRDLNVRSVQRTLVWMGQTQVTAT